MREEANIPTPTSEDSSCTTRDFAIAFLLLLGGVLLRLPQLDPQSLWIDDAWVALVSKAGTWQDAVRMSLTSPVFGVLMHKWFSVVGFSNLKAQLPAFMCGISLPPVMYLSLRQIGLKRLPALVPALAIVGSPAHVVYSDRVKQYTLDAWSSFVIMMGAIKLLRDPTRSWRWWVLCLLSLIGTILSAPCALVAGSGFLAGWHVLWRQRREFLSTACFPTVVFGCVSLFWWKTMLRPAVNEQLQQYWVDYYVSFQDGLLSAGESIGRALFHIGDGSLPFGKLSIFLIIWGYVFLFRKKSHLRFLFLFPPLVAFLAAALKLSPIGTFRTDIYLYVPIVMALGFVASEMTIKRQRLLVYVMVIACSLLPLWRLDPYPAEDIASLVPIIEEGAQEDEAVVLYPASSWPFALYSNWEVDFSPNQAGPNGFAVSFRRPFVYVLYGQRASPETFRAVQEQVALNNDVFWFLVSRGKSDIPVIEGYFRGLGFREKQRWNRTGATLSVWQREQNSM